MIKSIIGLGTLAIPSVLDNLGLVPGVIALCFVGFVTWWSTRVIGLFKLNHPEVYAIDDAGAVLLGKLGREVFGAAFCIRKYHARARRRHTALHLHASLYLLWGLLDVRNFYRS